MSGPLDDALARHDREREQEQRRSRDNHMKMQALIADFLRRMQAAGNPGRQSLGHHLDVYSFTSQGWRISYYCDCFGHNKWQELRIFVNGKIAYHETRNLEYYGPYQKASLGQLGNHTDSITKRMAEILHENGVR